MDEPQKPQLVDLAPKTIEELKSNIEDAEKDLMMSIPPGLKDSYDALIARLHKQGLTYNTDVQDMLANYKALIVAIDELPSKLKYINGIIREIANIKK